MPAPRWFGLPDCVDAAARRLGSLEDRVVALEYESDAQDRRIVRNEQLAGAAFAAAAQALEETRINRAAMERMFEESQRK